MDRTTDEGAVVAEALFDWEVSSEQTQDAALRRVQAEVQRIVQCIEAATAILAN